MSAVFRNEKASMRRTLVKGEENSSSSTRIIEPAQVYKQKDDADPEYSYVNVSVNDEAIFRDETEDSVSSKQVSPKAGGKAVTRKTRDEELDNYEEFAFGAERSETETKEDEQSMSTKTSPSFTGNAILMDKIEEKQLRGQLKSYLRVHAPKAVSDGRLEGIVRWTRTRGIAKLRLALIEQFSADLDDYIEDQTLTPISETSDKSLGREKSKRFIRKLFGRS